MISNTRDVDSPSHTTYHESAATAVATERPTPQESLATVPPSSNQRPPLRATFRIKYFLERVVATLLLIAALPVIGILCLIVRLNSKGPGIYSQTRVGMNGKNFRMYKIRSMVVDAEAKSGPAWSTAGDPRITTIGKALRFLHLDELPQLWNVVRGDMSVIGPRPERPDIVEVLEDYIEGYRDRLQVKPGITGLAQIYLPPDETMNCVRKKLCYDRAYIESATLWLDAKIWICTLLRMAGIRKGRGPRWCGLDRQFQAVQEQCDRISEAADENEGFALSQPAEASVSDPKPSHSRPKYDRWANEESRAGRVWAK